MSNEYELKSIIRKYKESIISHENYIDYPIKRQKNNEIAWVVVTKNKNDDSGKKRKEWAHKKIEQLNQNINNPTVIPGSPGSYAYLMYYLHPTKEKPCECCGKVMSLNYIYLNKNFIKRLVKNFPELKDKICETTSIYELKDLIQHEELREVIINTFNIERNNDSLDNIFEKCIKKCRDGLKMLGPGAMSNFPDRLDGFHSYNKCCRKTKDKGRHDENMKQYSKDRRAYEYFSDGNFQRANQYMKSEYFSTISADHKGAISLGFIHDMFNLFPMEKGKNSAKRDKIILNDLLDLIKIEEDKKIIVMSWFSNVIWDFIKKDITDINISELSTKEKNNKEDFYFGLLKQNMINFMYFLNEIIKHDCGNTFVIETILKPKYIFFEKEYEFPDIHSYIEKNKNLTEANEKEIPRLNRIAIESIRNFAKKENRKHKEKLNKKLETLLVTILNNLNCGEEKFQETFGIFKELMDESCLFLLE